jgi:hypothetical protein
MMRPNARAGGSLATLGPDLMTDPDLPGASSNFDLHAALRRHSWAWLGAIVRRLHFALEVVDSEAVVGPAIVTPAGVLSPRQLLAQRAPQVREALTLALRHNQRTRVSVDDLELLLVPLTISGMPVGALVVTRDSPSHAPSPETRSDAEMDAAAAWLARAIEAQLDVPTAENHDAESFDRVSSLHRLLHEALDRGIERDVLVAFAEALIAWDDIEVRAYVEDVRGHLLLAVATPGIDRSEAAVLPAVGVGLEPGLTRLAFAETARLGFRRDKDVLVARIDGSLSQPWLLVFSGAIAPTDESRLALYVDLLKQAVVRVATIAETRTSWAILQHLLSTTDSVEETGEMALAELTRAVEGVGSALVVTASNGVHALSIGDSTAFSTTRPASEFEEIVSTHQVLAGYTMVLAVRRAQGQTFTRREQLIVDRAASTFASWLPAVMPRLPQAQERRTENRGFDQVLDRVAVRNVADGLDVVVLVVVTPAAVSRPGLLHKWVAEIRGHLRASDLTGALSDREMGILLSGTTVDHLAVVRARILRRVALLDTAGGASPVSIGVASSSAGSVIETSLVDAARQDAARRAPGSEWP